MTVFLWLLAMVVLAVILIRVYPSLMYGISVMVQERREAEARAEKLLAEMLSSEEMDELNQRGYLKVSSRKYSNRIYYVPRSQGMVSVYENGVLSERLCVGSTVWIPDGDVVLMHKLMIEGNEEEYLRLANHFAPRPYSFPL